MGAERHTARARDLRRTMTVAERRLWSRLRRDQLQGHHFRRQHPIGPFVVDFACLEAKVVIELDGGHHVAQSAEDAGRTRWLTAHGFRVLRFWNHDVTGQLEAVLEVIADQTSARAR